MGDKNRTSFTSLHADRGTSDLTEPRHGGELYAIERALLNNMQHA